MSITGNHVVVAVASVIGIAAVVLVPDRNALANAFLMAIAVFCWMFVVLYGLRSQWRVTAPGRGVMRLMACMALLCTQGMATILSDYSYPGREIIRPVLMLGITLAVLDLLLTLIRIQRGRGVSRDRT